MFNCEFEVQNFCKCYIAYFKTVQQKSAMNKNSQFQRQKEADLSLQVGYRQVLKPGMKKNGYYPINSQALIPNSPL